VVAPPVVAITWTLWMSGLGQSAWDFAPQRRSTSRPNQFKAQYQRMP